MTAYDWAVDVILAFGIFGVALMQLSATNTLLIPDSFARKILGVTTSNPTIMAFIGVGICTAPVIFRRKFSWASFIFCLAFWAFFQVHVSDASVSILPLLVSLLTLCALRPMDDAFLASLFAILVVVVVPFAREHSILTNVVLIQNLAFVFAGAGVGIAFRTSKDLVYSAELRAEQAEKTAQVQVQQRLEKERVAIARELHDITAHSLSAISIQAAAAEALIDKKPEEAKSQVANIRKISKDSLAEIRRMIGVLRDTGLADEEPELLPTQGTDEIPEIKNYLEAAGINCTIDMDNYDKENVPSYVDIAIFGICREAATNAVKHSKAENIKIKIESRDLGEDKRKISGKEYAQFATLEFSDDGVGLSKNFENTGGHGVEGMQERVYALHGDFDMKNRLPHGTLIYVVLPLKKVRD